MAYGRSWLLVPTVDSGSGVQPPRRETWRAGAGGAACGSQFGPISSIFGVDQSDCCRQSVSLREVRRCSPPPPLPSRRPLAASWHLGKWKCRWKSKAHIESLDVGGGWWSRRCDKEIALCLVGSSACLSLDPTSARCWRRTNDATEQPSRGNAPPGDPVIQ
jgi:hypothetical protein